MVRRNIDRAAAVVAISEYVAKDIRTHLRIEESRLHVIHNGADRIDLRKRVMPRYIPKSRFCFTIGPTIPKKNFAVLPALLMGNDMELVIAGFTEEPYLGTILERAGHLGVADRVHIVGPVAEGEKAWYYANCSAFAFPSLAEGFGLPVVEAMQMGRPVFLSRCTSLPEIGGELATYFDSFEPAAMSAIFNEAMAAPPDEAGTRSIVERARSFSWDGAARRYLNLYRACAGKGGLR